MPTLHMRDIECHTYGELPPIGQQAPNFHLAATDLSSVSLDDFTDEALLINVYPSIDTSVCFESVKTFSQAAANNSQNPINIVCVSMDLPFALKRVAMGEQLEDVTLLSDFRNRDFGDSYGLTIADGPLAGLLARAVIVLDKQHRVVYHELVEDVTNPPAYDKALSKLS